MTTIYDVAKEAKVSVATVSRVLNNNGYVSEEKRMSVKMAIEKLNYRPNLLGRNLRKSESRIILALLPSISNPFYSKILKGIEDVAIKNEYNILLCSTDSDRERERIYLNLINQKLADGIISMNPIQDKDFFLELSKNYPIIQCSEYNSNIKIPYVSIDNFRAAYDATHYLISLGCKKIALINSNEKYLYARLRKEGYLQALRDNNITIKDDLIICAGIGFQNGYDAVKRILSKEKVDGIFAVADILALGAIKGVKELGYSIPSDISIIGFDDIEISTMVTPTLTTIAQPMYELGQQAAKLIIKRIKDPNFIPENILLKHQLVIRESTKKI
ncbi:LacI family DNA-binding transcriptional regulator [Caloramator sp. CAR-1]|uniref:LacI family DNA-binding transcriptional regulator n=1 Tax=Caloramator sp. CAR-1 TaxID=3062777 RepID=UPI0026E3AD6F|nr:LacI family DNA-binding transcriptional regulator [Caloramator sp. CAR-1]